MSLVIGLDLGATNCKALALAEVKGNTRTNREGNQ